VDAMQRLLVARFLRNILSKANLLRPKLDIPGSSRLGLVWWWQPCSIPHAGSKSLLISWPTCSHAFETSACSNEGLVTNESVTVGASATGKRAFSPGILD